MALKRVWLPSPNCSSRGGSAVRLVVLHTAEGARSFRDLGAFFANPNAQVSSHVGIDDERGSIGEYVKRDQKAWTQSNYNPQAVGVELCAAPIKSDKPCGASWSIAEWNLHDGMLANVADWIREECQHYDLPIVKLTGAQAQGSGRGICGHVDLGAGGGGHYDPGPNFPWKRVLDLARGDGGSIAPSPPKPAEPLRTRQSVVVVVKRDGGGEAFVEADDGEIWHRWTKDDSWSAWASLGVPGGSS